MFLNKKFILASELSQKIGIKSSYISFIKKQFGGINNCTKTLGNAVFLNREFQYYPKRVSNAILNYEFTDMSDKLPRSYVNIEYGVYEKELKNAGMVIDKVSIAGKDFFVFDKDIAEMLRGKIGYALNAKETFECYERNLIDGYIQLTKNKFFTWYSVGSIEGKETFDGDYNLDSGIGYHYGQY